MKQFIYRISCLSLLCLSLVLISVTNDSVTITTEAFPSGAGACVAGKSSVGGSHKSKSGGKKVIPKTLTNAGITILIDGIAVAEGGKATVKSNTAIAIKVSGKAMKGVNIRVGAPSGVSTNGVLTPGSGLKLNSFCKSQSVGVTQKKATSVSSYSSTIKFPSATNGVVLDVTIVFKNTERQATHAYGKVTVDFA
jgi:hypothetical protein